MAKVFEKMAFDYEYIAAKFMLIIFKVLGLAPFTVKRTGHNLVPLTFSLSRFGCLYNVLLVAAQFRILFSAVPNAFSDVYPSKTDTTVAISLAASVLVNLAILTIYLTFGLRQKTAVRLLNNLLSVGSTIVAKNGRDTCQSSRNFFLLIFLINVVVTTGFETTRVLAFHFRVISLFRVDMPIIIVAWFITTYIFVIKLIVNRLRAVNRGLLDHSVVLSLGHNHRLFVTQQVSFNAQLAPEIIIFRKVHANLYEIASEVSEFYSLPILLAIVPSCCTVIYCAYFLVIPIISVFEAYSKLVIVTSVLFMITSILPIIILAFVVNTVTAEMKRTADIVNQLIIRANINGDDAIELKQFALELINRKVQFTACGFFSLDCSLLHSILSMVTTYLIILIQHQMGHGAMTDQNQIQNCTNVQSNSAES